MDVANETVWNKAQHKAFAIQLLAANKNAAQFLTEEILEALVDQKVMQVVLNNHRDISRASMQALREGIMSWMTRGPVCVALWFESV